MTLQASLESKTKAVRRAEQAAQQRAEHAQHELAVARRECDRSAGDAEDRKVQLSVLVETVETLQAGTPGETHAAVPLMLIFTSIVVSCCNTYSALVLAVIDASEH